MAVKIGTLIANLGKKAGLDMSDAKFADVLAIATELPDDVSTALEQKLIPIDDAHTNGIVRGKIHKEIYDGFDSKVLEMVNEFELDDASKAEIKSIEKTTDKYKATLKKVKELEAKKADASKNTDKSALQTKIDELNGQLSTLKTTYEKQIAELKTGYDGQLLDRDVEVALNGYNFANKDISVEDNVFLANKKVRDALASKGWKVQRDPNNPRNLIVVDKDGIPATDDNHNKVVFKGFTDGVLSNAKLLAVNDPDKGGGDGKSQTIAGGGSAKGNASLANEYSELAANA